MPINFNVAPYFDDFDEAKEFYRIPFLPGVALQARELTQIQSILQNQFQHVGDHLFKHGAMVIPGQITYDSDFQFVKLTEPVTNPIFQSLDPSNAINVGNTVIIQGVISGVQAQVVMAVGPQGTDPTTLYVKYLNSGTNGLTKTFQDLEAIAIVTNNVVGVSVATLTNLATGAGSAASIGQGIYYIYGFFVRVDSQTILLDKYDNSPTFKVGLNVVETIVKPQDDPSLNDNAQGSSNFAAPGAHRYKIQLILDKRDFASTSDDSFVELLRLQAGIKQRLVDTTAYNVLEDTFARRTFDESGDYTVNPFTLDIREHLNNGSNQGVFTPAQGGDSTKLMAILSPSKAYVRGYEIQTIDHTNVPVNKARVNDLQVNSFTRAFIGNYILVDKQFGMVPYNADTTITLADAKVTTDGNLNGSAIGTARVRHIEYDSGTIANNSTTFPYPVYKLFLFNIQINAGKTLDDVKSYFVAGSPGSSGNVLTSLDIRNFVGTFAQGTSITDGTNTEKVVSWNPVVGRAITETTSANPIPAGTPITDGGGNSGTLFARTKVFDTEDNILIYKLPQNVVKTVRGGPESGPLIHTTYAARQIFTATSTGGDVTFTTAANQIFVPFSPIDYVLTVAGVVQDIATLTFSITAGSTQFTIHSVPAGAVKFSATIQKQIAQEKTKTLTDNTGSPLVVNTPVGGRLPTTISLGKPDIFKLVSVIEIASGKDITSRYVVDNGQRDNLYDIGSISLAVGQPNSNDATGITIIFQYFTHSTNGDYFSVDSYTNFNSDVSWYSLVPIYRSPVSGISFSLRDCFDFRPRVDDNGTTFTNAGNLVKPNSDVVADFRYYLARVDKLYLDFKGNFNIVSGTPSLAPLPPPDPKDGMVLYILTLNAYTFSDKDLKVKFIENKRYTMRDIGKLETRIQNVEYYTSLNLLEKETASLSIIDTTTGLDRFKNGFVVDPFTGSNIGDVFNSDYRVAIDAVNKQARPLYNADAIDLSFNTINSSNYEYRTIKPTNDLLTCKYTQPLFIQQPFASRVENVNPYAIYSWQGSMVLDPPNDYWMDTSQRPDILVNDDSAFDSVVYLQQANRALGTVWNAWQTDWTGTSEQTSSNTITSALHSIVAPDGRLRQANITTTSAITTTTTAQSRTGITTTAVPKVVSQTINNRVVNVVMLPFIRSRYVKFIAQKLKPFTQVYPFFDGVAVGTFCHQFDATNPTNPLSIAGIAVTEATITAIQRVLTTDAIGNVTGWFLIPPSSSATAFKAGARVFRLTDDTNNADTASTYANATYTAQGTLETVQATVTSVRVPEFVTQQVTQNQVLTNTKDRVISTDITYIDPLAQTFLVADKPGGAFMSKIDLFFFTKDATTPVSVQIREVTNGYPSQKVVPFSDVTLAPSQVNISTDSTVATTFSFPSPVYLQNNTEYAFVILSNSNNYQVFVSRLGEKMINSDRIISQQPYAGVLFKSQNASTWTAEQLEDIKFNLYRCAFDTNPAGATILLTNPVLPSVTLGSLPFVTSKTSSLVRIKHPDHGMPVGSTVTVGIPGTEILASGGTGAIYNGINSHALGGIVISADGNAYKNFVIGNVELDFYTIDSLTAATASGDIGPTGVVVTQNRQMDLLNPVIQQLTFSNTAINWGLKTTSGQSVDGTQTPYSKDLNFTPIVVNENIPFTSPRLVASDINEQNLITYGGNLPFDKKSLVLQAVLSTTVDNVSPIIDTKRMGAIVVANRIDNSNHARNIDLFDDFQEFWIGPNSDIVFHANNTITTTTTDLSKLVLDRYIGVSGTTNNNTTAPNYLKVVAVALHSITVVPTDPAKPNLINESPASCTLKPFDHFTASTANKGVYNPSQYIIRRITLQNPANSLHVYVTAMRPPVAALDVFYRVLPVAQTSTNFDNLEYTLMTLDPQIDASSAQTPTDFKEYVWQADNIGDFISFAVKIVMKSTDTTQVPLLKDFRAIALGT